MSYNALLFSGQGSQVLGMGRSLAEQSKEAMELWKTAERISHLPLREIYWEGDDAAMADTRALQPALTALNLTLWQAFAPRFTPHCTAGHSLGEYASLAAAGVLSVATTLELVTLRGALMAEADPDGKGAMAAVLKMERQAVQDIVAQVAQSTGEVVLIANYNTPGQLVVSGSKVGVEGVMHAVKEQKGRALPLKVSGAFHSPLMAEAAAELRPALEKASWNKARFAIYCNVHGQAVQDADSVRQCMVAQMTSSVQWIDTIQNQWKDGVRAFVEIGPKAVLAKMVQPCLAAVLAEGESATTHTLSTLEEIHAWGA